MDDAATSIGVSRSTLYARIKKGTLSTVRTDGDRRVYLHQAEVTRLRLFARERPGAAIAARQQATGSSREAACRWVWRQEKAGRPSNVKMDTPTEAEPARPRLVKKPRRVNYDSAPSSADAVQGRHGDPSRMTPDITPEIIRSIIDSESQPPSRVTAAHEHV